MIFAIEYADSTKEEMRIPAEIWRRNNLQVQQTPNPMQQELKKTPPPAGGNGQ